MQKIDCKEAKPVLRRCLRIRLPPLISVLLLVATCDATAFGQKEDGKKKISPFVEILNANQIEPTKQGVRKYLHSLLPQDVDAVVSPLVDQLNSESYRERKNALRRLKQVPNLSIDTIRRFVKRNEKFPERVVRLQKVIEHLSEIHKPDIQRAVFRHISTEKYTGFVDDILKIYSNLNEETRVRRAACDALTSTAENGDYLTLAALLDDSETEYQYMRVAALRGMWRLDPNSTTTKILSINDDVEGLLAMDSARMLIEAKNTESLKILLRLTNEKQYRPRSVSLLRRLTGKSISYADFNEDEIRQQTLTDLKQWIADNPSEIDFSRKLKNERLGRILTTDYNEGKIVEYDESGNEVWSTTADHPFACKGLPNGHRLVSLYSSQKLVEYDAEGEIYKEFTGLPSSISGLDRTEDGRTLIAAGQGGNKVMELDADGDVVLDLTIEGMPTSVEELENGNFLLAMYGTSKLVEIDREGTVVHEIPISSKPYHASRLESGNYLVSCASDGKLMEYTHEGELVWELKTKSNIYHAQRFDDGTTVYGDSSGVFHVDADSKLVGDGLSGFSQYVYCYYY